MKKIFWYDIPFIPSFTWSVEMMKLGINWISICFVEYSIIDREAHSPEENVSSWIKRLFF